MSRLLRFGVVALLTVSIGPPLAAQEKRPKIGLALSGGGAKGFAHVGVLKVLEEMNIAIDFVAGTSMGVVVGALYASGMSPDEIEKKCAEFDWNDALDDSTAYAKLVFRRKQDIARYPSTIEFGLNQDGKLKMATAYRTGQKLSVLLGRFLATYHQGGRTTTNGVPSSIELNNTRLGLTYTRPLTLRQSLKVAVATGVISEGGTDFDQIQVAYQASFMPK